MADMQTTESAHVALRQQEAARQHAVHVQDALQYEQMSLWAPTRLLHMLIACGQDHSKQHGFVHSSLKSYVLWGHTAQEAAVKCGGSRQPCCAVHPPGHCNDTGN